MFRGALILNVWEGIVHVYIIVPNDCTFCVSVYDQQAHITLLHEMSPDGAVHR